MEISKADIQAVYENWEKRTKCMNRFRLMCIVKTMRPKDYAEAFWKTLEEIKKGCAGDGF